MSSPTSRSFSADVAKLRTELDGDALSPEESVRLRNRIDQTVERRRKSRWLAYGTLMAGSVGVVAAIVALIAPDRARPDAWYEASKNAACIEAGNADRIAVGSCAGTVVVRVGPSRVALEPNTVLANEPDQSQGAATTLAEAEPDAAERDRTVVLHRGTADFEVEPSKHRRRRFRVRVSGGTIVVLGTHFRAVEHGRSGEVRLFHGRIEFQPKVGPPLTLRSGQRLAWPLEPHRTSSASEVTEPTTAEIDRSAEEDGRGPEPSTDNASEAESATAPYPKKRAAGRRGLRRGDDERAGIEHLMQRFFQLRSQRRYRDAAELLGQNLDRTDFSAAQRARLSFELALLLDDQLGDHQAACRRYRAHARAFPRDQVRRPELDRRLARCD